MYTLTIREALKRRDEVQGHYLYIVHDANRVIYVGQSKHPFARLRQHVQGVDGLLGYTIRRYKPGSLLWIVDVLTIEDCEPIIEEHAPSFGRMVYMRHKGTPGKHKQMIDIAEQALVFCHRPVCNRSMVKVGREG